MPKCDFAAYFQKTFYQEHLWMTASGVNMPLKIIFTSSIEPVRAAFFYCVFSKELTGRPYRIITVYFYSSQQTSSLFLYFA